MKTVIVNLTDTLQATVHLCNTEEYNAVYEAHKVHAAYEPLCKARGFEISTELWIDVDAIYLYTKDEEGLLAHELGHVKGLNHCFPMFPYTMNFTGLLRWRDPEQLRPIAAKVLD